MIFGFILYWIQYILFGLSVQMPYEPIFHVHIVVCSPTIIPVLKWYSLFSNFFVQYVVLYVVLYVSMKNI